MVKKNLKRKQALGIAAVTVGESALMFALFGGHKQFIRSLATSIGLCVCLAV